MSAGWVGCSQKIFRGLIVDDKTNKIRAIITVQVTGEYDYTARELLDWMEERLRIPLSEEWGSHHGGVNCADGEVVSVRLSMGKA